MVKEVSGVIIVLLVVCSVVAGFLMNELITEDAPLVYNLTCVSDNITLECPRASINLDCPEPPACICECGECQRITNEFSSHFQQIISSVYIERGYEYDHMNWNCDEMSDELKDRLRNADYNCRTRVGFYNNGTDRIKHQWVECKDIIVEATNGEIVHPDEYWRYV